MKITKKEINLIIGLLGVLIAVAAWMLVAKPMKEKTVALETENVALKEKSDEYQAVNAQRTQFETDTVSLIDERARLLQRFAPGMSREDEIMFWANLERANSDSVALNNLSMSGWEEVYVERPAEETEEGASALHLYRAPVNYSYQATYDGLKKMMEYVFASKDKKSVEMLTVAFDGATGNLTGTMDMNMYYMNGTGSEYAPSVIPTVPTGVADIFKSVDSLEKSSSVSEFDGSEETSEEE